ncbi:hypothetical protein GGD61_007504 [Bradyrhizobium sp. SBR1B]|nr:hypothetical protein [Bradyrhizobium sp. SBR1B]
MVLNQGEKGVNARRLPLRTRIFRCAVSAESLRDVMAGPVPAIHALPHRAKNVDARDKPGHDGIWCVREETGYAPAAFFAITLR